MFPYYQILLGLYFIYDGCRKIGWPKKLSSKKDPGSFTLEHVAIHNEVDWDYRLLSDEDIEKLAELRDKIKQGIDITKEVELKKKTKSDLITEESHTVG